MKKWQTSISNNKDGEHYVRGVSMNDLINNHSFIDTFYFILKGEFPNKNQSKVLNAILVACIEHGVEVPSAFVPRTILSTGNEVNAALAAGMLSIGNHHGGVIENAMKLLLIEDTPENIVKNKLDKKERLPGYGHKIYKDEDPRVASLYKIAEENKINLKYINKSIEIKDQLEKQSGKNLPINVDGGIAAILLGLDFEPHLGKAFFALGRMGGMIVHIDEEIKNPVIYHRLDEEDVEYKGK